MPDLRLVIFDVDGTLIDSQAEIMAAMEMAYAGERLAVPAREDVLSIVGLSLIEAFTRLSPDDDVTRLVDGYKAAFNSLRGPDGKAELSPMFAGAREVLAKLHDDDHTILAVATGKSRRGLDKMIERHGLEGMFISQQTADHHPSKPNPAMVLAALRETGVDAWRAVMVGDTTYDMDMGRAAGVRTLGVGWGYHPVASLTADAIAATMDDLLPRIDQLTGEMA